MASRVYGNCARTSGVKQRTEAACRGGLRNGGHCTIATPEGNFMYLHDTIKGENCRQFCEQTLKLNPAEFDLDAVNRVEVYGTDINDPGEDYCEFRVIDCHNKVMAVRREMGY